MNYKYDDKDNYFDEEELIDEEYVDDEEIINEEIEDDGEEKRINILNQLVKKKNKNMYFDEEYVKGLIMNDYLPYLEYGINEKGKKVCTNRDRVDKEIEREIMGNLLLIANAIINKYRYWRFESLDDLQAESLKAMWEYLPKFDPEKGNAFDLFSLICKKHLLNFTLKNKRNRDTNDIDCVFDISARPIVNYNLMFEDMEKTFLEIIDRHYLREKRKKYIELTSILMEYLDKNKKIVGKNDLLAAYKSYGYKSTDYKKFIEDISKYKQEFYN